MTRTTGNWQLENIVDEVDKFFAGGGCLVRSQWREEQILF